MPAYMLTWNPDLWPWEDVEEAAERTSGGRVYETEWSCGNRKNIAVGDKIFLIRCGKQSRGIVASGRATTRPRVGEHWGGEPGKVSHLIEVTFDRVLSPAFDEPLSEEALNSDPLVGFPHGMPEGLRISGLRVGGLDIPDRYLGPLEVIWRNHLDRIDRETSAILTDTEVETFPEGRLVFCNHRKRERNREVIERAKANAMRRDGILACGACGFDFLDFYGAIGEGYIEGHHTKPLSDLTEETETAVEDIALVCSNCHRMLHRRRPWLSIGELSAILSKSGTKN